MPHFTAVIVGTRSSAAAQLWAILDKEEIPTALISPDNLSSALPDLARNAAIVLVSAALPDHVVLAVRGYAAARNGERHPPIVVFAEQHASELECHVEEGVDYLVPPFCAEVLRCRLAGYRADTEEALADVQHLARYEKELQIGREIQAGFLPDEVPTPPGWQIEVRFHPARQVAGDFYDAFDLVNGLRTGFVIADVCDKGVGAALFMALIRSLLRNVARHGGALSLVGLNVEWDDSAADDEDPRPSPVSAGIGPLLNAVTWTDDYMVQNHLRQGYFATLFFGLLDPVTGTVVYINCGHNPPLLRRGDGSLVSLPPTGPALGMMPGSSFRLGWVQLGPDDMLFLYTDGVTEAKDEHGRFFGEERVRDILTGCTDHDARKLLAKFDAELAEHVGPSEQFDDITMMAVCRSEPPLETGLRPGPDGSS